MKKINKSLKFILIFIFFLVISIVLIPINLDEIWSYGFSYNIVKGNIPYKDFNMVITPLYPLINALFLKIFGNSIFILQIINSITITLIIYLSSKITNNKHINLIILLLIFPVVITFPNYNIFILFLFLLIIYLENNYKEKDYLIGFIIGLLFLTKQSVGGVVLLSIFFYFKNKRKVLKRFIGFIIPCIIFLIYLIISNSLYNFLDLCLFGLFDFYNGNKSNISIYLILSILLLSYNVYLIIKNKNNINYYYLLTFFSILIPLFDYYHLIIYLVGYISIYLINKDVNIKYLKVDLFINILIIGSILITSFYRLNKDMKISNIKHFEGRVITSEYINTTNIINSKYKEYGYNNVIFLSADGYYFKIINDLDINYLDLINKGNFGYNGHDKLLKLINNNKDKYYFVDLNELEPNRQTDKDIINYVINNSNLIDEFLHYKVYKFRENK